MALIWTEDADDDNNTTYVANSAGEPYLDGPAEWIITPLLVRNVVVWTIENSSFTVTNDEDLFVRFTTLDEAKAHCERREAELAAKAKETL